MSIRYCSVDPKFPKKGYLVTFFFSNEVNQSIYPIENFYLRPQDAIPDMQEMRTKYPDTQIYSELILVPLHFNHHIEMKKEYWTESKSLPYNIQDRIKVFLRFLGEPVFYEMLVVCSGKDRKKKWRFNSAIPLKLNASQKEIDNFMYNSNLPVDERSKYSAIYSIGTPKRFNWETGEITKAVQKKLDLKN